MPLVADVGDRVADIGFVINDQDVAREAVLFLAPRPAASAAPARRWPRAMPSVAEARPPP